MELQKRGAAHGHCLVVAPGDDMGCVKYKGREHEAPYCLRSWWLESLRILGKHHFAQILHRGKSNQEEIILDPTYHGSIIYADRKAVNIQIDGGRGAWLRYLQDHATKSKQEQEAGPGWGRHWGVVGRGLFGHQSAYASITFSTEQKFAKFLRTYQRLCTPGRNPRERRASTWPKFTGRVFDGRAIGWRIKRGRRGSSVWFSNPETVWRIAEWAESE
jgi:hypothetical protein